MVIHRVSRLQRQLFPGASPPRLRYEDNALELAASAATDAEAIGVLARSVGRNGVTAATLLSALPRHPRLARRALIARLVDDVAAGTCSVLEQGYRDLVERAHGLPAGVRQLARRTRDGMQFRDVAYEEYGVIVETDGRLGHDSWQAQGRDADRDLDELAAHDTVTARLRWKQVFDTPCHTAGQVARVLQRRGWTGRPRRCGPDCALPVDASQRPT